MKIDPHSPFASLESVKRNLLKYIQKETQIRLIGAGGGDSNTGTKNKISDAPVYWFATSCTLPLHALDVIFVLRRHVLVDFGIVDEVDVTEVELKVQRAIKVRKPNLTQISRKLVKRIYIYIYLFSLLPVALYYSNRQ